MTFIGHVVSKDVIMAGLTKIKEIHDWTRPTSLSKVRSFISLATYYRQFIEDFASIAIPMTRLT